VPQFWKSLSSKKRQRTEQSREQLRTYWNGKQGKNRKGVKQEEKKRHWLDVASAGLGTLCDTCIASVSSLSFVQEGATPSHTFKIRTKRLFAGNLLDVVLPLQI
jgi:hypothetical protein